MVIFEKAEIPNCNKIPANKPEAILTGIKRINFPKYPDKPKIKKAKAKTE